MSIQDESFPTDELLDELLNTPVPPARRHYQYGGFPPKRPHNTTKSEPNTSAESSADGTELDNAHNQHTQHGDSGRRSKAVSYQDIHSEYTKRRFKNVGSKVGQYIAQIKIDDKKRSEGASMQNKSIATNNSNFLRHRSMPESLTPRAGDAHLLDTSCSMQHEHDIDAGTYERLKQQIEHLQSDNDYLREKLDDKMLEIIALKRDRDITRIEFGSCKDKLRQALNNNNRNNSLVGHGLLQHRYMTQTVPLCTQETKATQTDLLLQLTPLHATIDLSSVTTNISDNLLHMFDRNSAKNADISNINNNNNNSSSSKNVATIQPISLNFSNDSADVDDNGNAIELHRARHTTISPNTITLTANSQSIANNHNSGTSQPSSNDSAIEIDVLRVQQIRPSQYDQYYFHEKRLKRFNDVAINNSNSNNDISNASIVVYREEPNNASSLMDPTLLNGNRPMRHKRKLRARMLRIFGSCARCDDPNLDNTTTTIEIPLLERSLGPSLRNQR